MIYEPAGAGVEKREIERRNLWELRKRILPP
jgi:hypothetical protein